MSLVVPFEEIFEDHTGLLANHPTWERVELGAICKILNGFAFKSSLFNKEKGFPVVRIRDLSKGFSETFYDGDFPSEYIVYNNDLLIGMDGIFRCWEWHGGKAGLNQRVCKIIPNETFIDRKFLLYGLNGYLKAIEDATSSVTVGHLSSLDVLRIPFPLPPFPEQRRIVAKLEKLLHKVDASKERLDKIPAILKRFRQSVLAAACSGRLTADWREKNSALYESDSQGKGEGLPEGWTIVFLKDVAGMRLGKMLDKKKNIGEPTPYLRNINVRWFSFELTDLALMRATEKDKDELKIQNGDLLVCEGGEPGRCAVWHGGKTTLIFQKAIHRIRTAQHVLPTWIAFNLKNDADVGRLEEYFTGTTIKHLTGVSLSEYRVTLPPLPEQHEIVRRVEALFKKADEIEARYKKAKGFVDGLTQSILAKAFRGELVPQDPKDEPAEKLLERIGEEREFISGTLKRKKPLKRKIIAHAT